MDSIHGHVGGRNGRAWLKTALAMANNMALRDTNEVTRLAYEDAQFHRAHEEKAQLLMDVTTRVRPSDFGVDDGWF